MSRLLKTGVLVMNANTADSDTGGIRLSIYTMIVGVIFTALVGGVAGLISVAAVIGVLNIFGGWDSAAKHGISDRSSCRLGGVILVAYPICFFIYKWLIGEPANWSQASLLLIATGMVFFSIGLFEDLTSILSARRRLVLMLLCASVATLAVPDIVAKPMGIPVVDYLLGFPLVACLMTILALTYLPNAFNIADGANGLLSGICLFALYGLMRVGGLAHFMPLEVLFIGCLIFFALNLLTGRLFLGDGGAYFLGFIVGISMIIVSNQAEVSPWYLAMLVFYPSTDFLFSMIRRKMSGRPTMTADDEHFHNLLYRRLKRTRLSPLAANTLTGVIIASLWSASTIAILEWVGATHHWLLVYTASWIVFVIAWWLLKRSDRAAA